MEQETFKNGLRFYFRYDGAGPEARCTRTWGDENYYNGRFVYEPGCTTHITDDPAAVETYYHEQGLVTTHIDPLGAQHHWRYNAHAELEAQQDPLGNTTSYDARGHCTGVTYPDNAQVSTQFDEKGRAVQGTDANGGTWQWTYTAAGELASRTDPTGATTHYRYDAQGRVTEAIDALGHRTCLRYDAQHNLAHVVSPDEAIRFWEYDALGRLMKATDAAGNAQHRRYDRRGRLVGLRTPDGRKTALAYDAEGNVVQARDADHDVHFAYTAVNQLALRRQAGQEVRYDYDRQGRLTGLTNEHGRRYRFALDATGRVREEVGFDGLLRRYERDAAGRVTTLHRPADRSTAYQYDPAGRVTAVAHHDGTTEAYAYDPTGALAEAQNATTTVRLERDALGRVVREQQGAHTVEHTYDARGQRTGLQSSLGAAFAWQHDALGNLTAVRAGDALHAQLLHDVRGLELQRTLSGGLRVGWQHDALGRPVQQQVAAGAGPHRQRRYQWEGADRLTGIDYSLTGTTRYAYDAIGTLTGARYADGSEDVRLADAVGNLFRSPALNDRTYAPGGQLRRDGGTRYAYDAEGNLVRKTTPDGQTWHYNWNGAGQLASVRRPDGYAVTFQYDALGRRLSKRFRGRLTRWVWDGDKPLHEWSELEIGPEAGAVQDLATWLFEQDSFAPAAKLTAGGAQSVVCDHLGTPLSLFDARGAETWRARLDSYGAVRQGLGKAQDCPFRYQGQYEDVETGLYYNRFRYYDPDAGQYISQDPIGLLGGMVPYGYVHNSATWIDVYGLSGENPFDYLDFALKQRGFSAGDPIPVFNTQMKHSWSDVSTRYTYEVRAKAAATQHGRTGNEFRVARKLPPPPHPQQGAGMEYLDHSGNWHYERDLKLPQNSQLSADTYIEIPSNRKIGC